MLYEVITIPSIPLGDRTRLGCALLGVEVGRQDRPRYRRGGAAAVLAVFHHHRHGDLRLVCRGSYNFV